MIYFIILYILLVHWVGDFLFQTTEMGTKKSESNRILMWHVTIYTTVLIIGMVPLLGEKAALFGGISALCHGTQDYITSRMTKKQFGKGIYNGWNGGFTIIGFDQFMHYVQLLVTFMLIT